jgi:hypothetical protein
LASLVAREQVHEEEFGMTDAKLLYAVFQNFTDGFTYNAQELGGIFDDLDLARKCAENGLKKRYADHPSITGYKWEGDTYVLEESEKNKSYGFSYMGNDAEVEIITINEERKFDE